MFRAPLLVVSSLAAAVLAQATGGSLRVTLTDSKGRHVEDAVVSLVPLDGQAVPAPAPRPVEVAQKNQTFIPYVTAVAVGTSVVFPNEDTVQHHIYSLSKPKHFEKPLYAPGSHESVVFDQPGVVTLGCNIHDWMIAYIVVLPTPIFSKTPADGTADFREIPAGRYRLDVWHPLLTAPQSREITVAVPGDAAQEFVLALKPDRRIRRATDGKAGTY